MAIMKPDYPLTRLPGEPGGVGARKTLGEIVQRPGGDLRQGVVVSQIVLRLPERLMGSVGERQIQPELGVVQHLAASSVELVEPQGRIVGRADACLPGHNRGGNHEPRYGIA